MAADPVVKISEVRSAVNRILDSIERAAGPDVVVDADYYWNLPLDAAFELSATPRTSEIDASQLSDDVVTLRELLTSGEDEPIVVWHDLSHVIGVLRFLAWRDVPR